MNLNCNKFFTIFLITILSVSSKCYSKTYTVFLKTGSSSCVENTDCIYTARGSRSERIYCTSQNDSDNQSVINRNCGINKEWTIELFEKEQFGYNKIKKILKVKSIESKRPNKN